MPRYSPEAERFFERYRKGGDTYWHELGERVRLIVWEAMVTARRDWNVRVLDAWARSQGHGFSHHCVQTQSGSFVAQGTDGESIVVEAWVLADTEDAARHAAALAVFPTLTEAVRAELGERP